jgi:hypothetical protein
LLNIIRKDRGVDIIQVGELEMTHFLTSALQKSIRIVDVNAAPKTEIDGILESLDICKRTIELIYRLGPLDRFLSFRCHFEDDLANF